MEGSFFGFNCLVDFFFRIKFFSLFSSLWNFFFFQDSLFRKNLLRKFHVQMLNLVETFLLQQIGDHNKFSRTIQKMKDEVKNIKHSGLVQTNILKYFFSS